MRKATYGRLDRYTGNDPATSTPAALPTRIKRQESTTLFPPETRSSVLTVVAAGTPLAEAMNDVGLTEEIAYGRTRWDHEWASALDAAQMAGRDPRLRHGSAWTYTHHGCHCPECRLTQPGCTAVAARFTPPPPPPRPTVRMPRTRQPSLSAAEIVRLFKVPRPTVNRWALKDGWERDSSGGVLRYRTADVRASYRRYRHHGSQQP
ncbi:hypothetical protein [Streptosporangium sp. CA-115845]|uniref:hypothetical protein n=1 Tax=Streptosporangium sp. CA-115845 TaxID=3240071 RepID=UPI003D94D8B5